MDGVMTRRAVLALLACAASLGLTACDLPTVPTAPWCGVDTLQVPVTIGDTTYWETLLMPRDCDE